jgi:putative redox protein
MVESKVIWTDHFRFVGEASSGHAVVIDAGEKKTAGTPVELVLIGLCGCTASDVVNILRKKRERFTSLQVSAKAERASSPPTVFTEIKILYRVGGKLSHKSVEEAVRLSEEKYCSVAAMLKKTAKITYEIEYLD